MFCDYCGNKLRDGAKFCNRCGEPVTIVDEESKVVHEPPKTESQDRNNNSPEKDSLFNKTVESNRQYTIPQSQPQSTAQYQQPIYQTQSRPYYAPGTHPYHRLGGFLLFIVVGSYISGVYSFISVISTVITYSGLLSMGDWLPGGFKGWAVFSMIGSSILSIITGAIVISYANQIRSKDPNVLNFIQSSSITMMIISIVFYSISLIWIKQYDYYGVMKSGSIIGILIAMVIAWIVGLLISSIYAGTSVRLRTYMGSDSYLKRSLFNKNSHPIPADGSDQPSVIDYPKSSVSFDPNTQWVCPQCQRVNSNYVTTCQCGNPKPYIDLSKSWVCRNCGNVNMGNLHKCTSCGSYKNQDDSWTCASCGARNSGNSTVCSTCYAPKTSEKNKKQSVGQRDWQCPQCKRINPGYVTTCTCGCPSSMGVKLDTYSGGAAPEPERQPSINEWKCPNCGRINANYVGTCGCGQVKN